jgi:hypothetical protein
MMTVQQQSLRRSHNLIMSCHVTSLLQAAGLRSGDLCFPVPYAPEFFAQEFKSAVADMKNSVANRSNAQVSCSCHRPLSLLYTSKYLLVFKSGLCTLLLTCHACCECRCLLKQPTLCSCIALCSHSVLCSTSYDDMLT